MPRSNSESESVERRVFDIVRVRPGVTLAEIAEETGLAKYDVYRAIRALSSKGLVKVVEGERFDPYAPSMTREVYPASGEFRQSVDGGLGSWRDEEGSGRVVLVATHPRPPQWAVVNVSFLDAS